MSAQKFACPYCEQHIEADERCAGLEIQCPSCQQNMVIPSPSPAPALAASSAAPLRVTLRPAQPPSTPEPQPPPPASRPVFIPQRASLGDEEEPSRGSKIVKAMVMAALLALMAGGLVFAFTWGRGVQNKFNEAQAKDEDPGMVGGQVGHIAELYQVMDETDRIAVRGADEDRSRRRAAASGASAAGATQAGNTPATPDAPPAVPARWTLDVEGAETPNGRVAGSMSGSNFVANDVVLYTGSATPILALRQGDRFDVERELLVYLRVKPGESLEGRSWIVARDQPAGAPQVVKRWKTTPRVAPQQQTFSAGYAMKLELGKASDGRLPGKIYLALPGPDQTVAGGVFTADIRVLTTARNQDRNAGSSFEE